MTSNIFRKKFQENSETVNHSFSLYHDSFENTDTVHLSLSKYCAPMQSVPWNKSVCVCFPA